MYNTNYFLYVPKVCCKCLDTAHKTISLTSNSRPLLITPEIKYKTIEGIALCKKHYIRLTISRILGAALIIIALIMANTITIDPFQHPSRGWIFYTELLFFILGPILLLRPKRWGICKFVQHENPVFNNKDYDILFKLGNNINFDDDTFYYEYEKKPEKANTVSDLKKIYGDDAKCFASLNVKDNYWICICGEKNNLKKDFNCALCRRNRNYLINNFNDNSNYRKIENSLEKLENLEYEDIVKILNDIAYIIEGLRITNSSKSHYDYYMPLIKNIGNELYKRGGYDMMQNTLNNQLILNSSFIHCIIELAWRNVGNINHSYNII